MYFDICLYKIHTLNKYW